MVEFLHRLGPARLAENPVTATNFSRWTDEGSLAKKLLALRIPRASSHGWKSPHRPASRNAFCALPVWRWMESRERAALSGNTNSKLKTEMTSTTETAFYKEPTHDEIALSAFLAWQKDGSPHGADFNYWIEAERRLRAQREKQAKDAAMQAAKPWPPGARAEKTKPATTSAAAAKPALASARERSTTVKVTRSAAPRSNANKFGQSNAIESAARPRKRWLIKSSLRQGLGIFLPHVSAARVLTTIRRAGIRGTDGAVLPSRSGARHVVRAVEHRARCSRIPRHQALRFRVLRAGCVCFAAHFRCDGGSARLAGESFARPVARDRGRHGSRQHGDSSSSGMPGSCWR